MWSWISHLLISVSSVLKQGRMLTLLCTGPPRLCVENTKTWSLKKHYWMNQLLLVPSLTKILKASVLQAAAKVRNISEFQSRRLLLLFVFFTGLLLAWAVGVTHWIRILLSYSARMHQRQAHTEGKRDERLFFTHQLAIHRQTWPCRVKGSSRKGKITTTWCLSQLANQNQT